MSRRSANLLHKKLSALESELVEAFRLPPHSASDQKISRRLQKRFDYINNLLSAEVSSTPEKPDQLDEIGEKIAGLEAAFRCWSDYRTCALNMYHDDAPVSVCSHCMDHDDDAPVSDDVDGPDSPRQAADRFHEGEESGRSWGKLCGAFWSGVLVGVVCCTTILEFASFYLYDQDLYFIPPT